ncbi:MAG TPA: SMC family ATPase [Pyrinomonadaceae bacterium]|nr:SMC family ATPase [Pyrinomonadaceae bacterium]
MHVTRVELENIKSYVHSAFDFERGTTAIMGENGAGKTTILEAIAWALFDTLDYSKEDFLRRGARKGSVRVSFISSEADERLYTVYRDTGNGYYIYDHGLSMKVAEKKVDVSAKLRQLLGIEEPGTDLKALFSSAIGVPQGTFTADFLRPANQRKASFDRLLKVEEYRDSAERLRETVNLISERLNDVSVRIGRAEGQLARYDEFVAEHGGAVRLVEELSAQLEELQREIETRKATVEEMDKREAHLAATRQRADRLNVEREAAERRLRDARVEMEAALQARERQQAVEADYRTHLEALSTLARLDEERRARDLLRAKEADAARLIEAARGDVRRIEEALERAISAAASIEALTPQITEQEELERERERLRDLRAQAMSERARVSLLDAELKELRAQYEQVKGRVKEAERGQGAEERVANLESERLGVETSLSATERAATSLKHLSAQCRGEEQEAVRLRREVETQRKQITELEKRVVKAREVVRLVTRETELTEQLAHLRAEISRDEKFRREVKNGLCPILSEKCLNIGEGQTLEDYFRGQEASNTAQLGVLEKERAGLTALLSEAREAERELSKLEALRAQAAGAGERLKEREASLARLDAEIAALPPASREHLSELRAKLMGVDGELIVEREAAMRYAQLKPLQQRLAEIEQEGKRKRDERASVAANAEAVVPLEKDIEETEERLRRLKDPRGRAASLRAEAESEAARRTELEGARDALRSLEEQMSELHLQLEAYRNLDAEWEGARGERDRTAPAHREYVSSETVAATLPAREAAARKAEEETARITIEAEKASAETERLAAEYDRERHAVERGSLALVRERAAALSAKLDAARTRESSLQAEIERLAKVREERAAEFREKERLERLDEATDFIRDTLKQAGPIITESYLYNISIEANQLFREITGEASRALRWSRDYEIILEEEGHERSFQNLSGGEQMAAALSIRLALLKQLSDIRMAFFDEPTVNMDAERRERLAQQIGQVQHFDQLFVISHDDTFEGSVDHVIHVARDGDAAAAQETLKPEAEGARAEG